MGSILRSNSDLTAAGLASLIAVVAPGWLKIPFGLALCLFLPGYGVVAVLYAETQALRWVERIALSIGSSIVILVLTALALSYSSWDQRPTFMPMALALITVLSLLVAWLRRQQHGSQGMLLGPMSYRGLLSRRTVISICITIAVLGFSGYSLSRPGPSEAFTSFYIVRSNDTIGSYSTTTVRTVRVYVGITNHERRQISYRIEVGWRRGSSASITTGGVANGGTWRHVLHLSEGGKERGTLHLSLFRADKRRHVYRSLLLRMPVRAASW